MQYGTIGCYLIVLLHYRIQYVQNSFIDVSNETELLTGSQKRILEIFFFVPLPPPRPASFNKCPQCLRTSPTEYPTVRTHRAPNLDEDRHDHFLNMGRGRLTFKGEKHVPIKKSKASKAVAQHSLGEKKPILPSVATAANENKEECRIVTVADETSADNDGAVVALERASIAPPASPGDQLTQIPIRKGKGQITVSGTVVTGHKTKFLSELNVGDAIIVYNQAGKEEMRVVTMRLSDISCAVSSSFPSSYKTATDYFYIPRPKNAAEVERDKKRQEELKIKQKKEEEQSAFGTYNRSDKLVYHEKSSTGTSYIIRTENLGRDVTREELLDLRSKKKSDKYCN